VNLTTPCPEADQLSTDDLMRIVTYRAELQVTRRLTKEMKEFIDHGMLHYSAEAIAKAGKLFWYVPPPVHDWDA